MRRILRYKRLLKADPEGIGKFRSIAGISVMACSHMALLYE